MKPYAKDEPMTLDDVRAYHLAHHCGFIWNCPSETANGHTCCAEYWAATTRDEIRADVHRQEG